MPANDTEAACFGARENAVSQPGSASPSRVGGMATANRSAFVRAVRPGRRAGPLYSELFVGHPPPVVSEEKPRLG